MFGAETVIPKGWVVCDGRALSRTNYEALFGAIGTARGSTGGTNFRVPDLRGRAPFGADAMGGSAAGRLTGVGTLNGGVGSTGGADTVRLTAVQMPSHGHAGSIGSAGAQPATTTGAVERWQPARQARVAITVTPERLRLRAATATAAIPASPVSTSTASDTSDGPSTTRGLRSSR